MAIPLTEAAERRTRLERMIEEFRAAKERQVLRRLARTLEAEQGCAQVEAPPERVH